MLMEHVSACPVCSQSSRKPLYESLWRCPCGVAYRSPRATRETIAQAYEGYHTHADAPDQFAQGGFRRRARNGYVNWRYGYHVQPASFVGALVVGAIPPLRLAIERWVQRVPYKAGGRLLDVGCGNGGWLKQMQQLGWTVQGVDFDPNAVAHARALGLDVRLGGIEVADSDFDVIACNHVIEHVHDPRALLQSCRAKGRLLWVATPNLDAIGHRLLRDRWRGLEPPRHLVLFDANSLDALLRETGWLPRGPLPTRLWASEHFESKPLAMVANAATLLRPRWSEELVFIAQARDGPPA